MTGAWLGMLLLVGVWRASAAVPFADGPVVPIGPETSLERGFWFVAFVIKGCGHCAALIPTWQQLANAESPAASIGTVDCDVHKKTLCAGVTSFPTMVWRRDGSEARPYHGQRDLASLRQFVAKQQGTAVREAGTR